MERFEELVRELHQEVLETRNVSIKTDHSLRNLTSDVKQIARRQQSYERRLLFNSVGAYLIFAALTFAGLLTFFRASIARTELDHELAAEQRASLEEAVSNLEAELERRRQSEREAWEFYELLVSGRRSEVVERWPAIQGRLLDRATIELFRREVDTIRHDLALEAFELGNTHVNNERWEDARDAFTASLTWVEYAPYTPDLHFQLAETLYELDDHAAAVRYFDLSIEAGELTRQESIRAYFHRAESLQASDRPREALEAYRLFERRYDGHYWESAARQRADRLEDLLDED